jgi:hypothetical protein
MFKKAVVVMQQKLRGSDVKRLKRDMVLAMPTLTNDDVDSAIPGKADVIMYKMSNRALVYAVDGRNPLVFDPVRHERRAAAATERAGVRDRCRRACATSDQQYSREQRQHTHPQGRRADVVTWLPAVCRRARMICTRRCTYCGRSPRRWARC